MGIRPPSGSGSSVQSSTLVERGLNAQDFAATSAQRSVVGDGALKPLSGFYGTLGAAQVDYPHATALTNQLDWAVLVKAKVAAAPGGSDVGNAILVPDGNCRPHIARPPPASAAPHARPRHPPPPRASDGGVFARSNPGPTSTSRVHGKCTPGRRHGL